MRRKQFCKYCNNNTGESVFLGAPNPYFIRLEKRLSQCIDGLKFERRGKRKIVII